MDEDLSLQDAEGPQDQEGQLTPQEVDASTEERPVESRVRGMYREYFLEYASYVILERAVPALMDGLKPVQRRLMHALKEMDDGRFHKVANVIGQTMKYHPHGDASIGDALVQLGQKNILVETQGNWGNIYTGDSAAAPRYIEARLSKFALEVGFNAKITEWQSSYDSRGREPVALPVKFPLLLAQGVEGIAVGLSTKVLPHNFVELIDASIAHLRGRKVEIYPDFPTGGIADFSQYNDGERGGRVRVRAKISVEDKKTLLITEIPFGTTTTSLIDSIIKANDRGKIKIKKIEDNTAEHVEILLHLVPGISPDQTVDALYAFTACETAISPLCCVIENDRPLFTGVSELLKQSTEHTVDLLRAELGIQLSEFQEQWHFASIEKIFIQERIYRDIEEAETWEQVLENIWEGLKPHVGHLLREVTEEDLVRLTEIKIKRISKFDADKADDQLASLEGKIAEIKHYLETLIDYAVEYFRNLKKKYAAGRERRTEIRSFDTVVAAKVAMANVKLYINREEGFMGTGLKRDEFVCDCSDMDDILVIRNNGTLLVTKVDAKKFVGKDILYAGVYLKGDDRTVYNLMYRDGMKGSSFVKRFAMTGVTRDKEYHLTQGTKESSILYLSVNPNGEAETVTVHLRALAHLKKLKWDVDFSGIAVRSRSARGNTVTKNAIKKIELKSEGLSTLAARKLWFDEAVLKLNDHGRGRLLGAFRGEDRLLQVDKNGRARIFIPELTTHFEELPYFLEKWEADKPYAMVYFDGEKERSMVKRFVFEPKNDQWDYLISDHNQSEVWVLNAADHVEVEVTYKKIKGKEKDTEVVNLQDFITVKGWKAAGNQLSTWPVKSLMVTLAENVAQEGNTREELTPEEPSVGDRPEVENPPVELLETQVMPLRDDPATQNLEDEKSEMLSVTLEEVDLSPKETHTSLPPVHDDVDTEDDGQFTLKF
jgi:topoisomerase IV subunit A